MGSSRTLDRILGAAVIGLFVIILALGAYFGWSVYADRVAARAANPALRVVDSLSLAVRKSPNDSTLRVRLGEAMATAGKPQQAIEQFNAALKIDPKHTGALLDLGQLALMNNRVSEAAGYFQKIIDVTAGSDFENINQKREVAYYELGRIALSQKDYEKAAADFKASLRIRNDASDTYYYLARAFDGMGQTAEAKKQLDIALMFDPNFAVARYYYGELYMRDGDKVNASYQFYRASKADPKSEEPKQALAQFGDPAVLIQQARSKMESDPQAALDAILIARNIDPENAAAAKLHAQILVAMGDTKNALDVYKQADKLSPNDAVILAAIKQLTPAPAKKKKK